MQLIYKFKLHDLKSTTKIIFITWLHHTQDKTQLHTYQMVRGQWFSVSVSLKHQML